MLRATVPLSFEKSCSALDSSCDAAGERDRKKERERERRERGKREREERETVRLAEISNHAWLYMGREL